MRMSCLATKAVCTLIRAQQKPCASMSSYTLPFPHSLPLSSYLLVARKSPGATLPLLAVLCAAARGGADVALSVCRERGLLAAVGELLDPAAALLPEQGADREAGEGAGGATGQGDATGAGAAAEGAERRAAAGRSGTAASVGAGAGLGLGPASAAHVAAVMLVRLLCCASPVAAQLVRTAGAGRGQGTCAAAACPCSLLSTCKTRRQRPAASRTWRRLGPSPWQSQTDTSLQPQRTLRHRIEPLPAWGTELLPQACSPP